ncbi:MAG: phosphoribosylamine--glycine ligase [Clostridia bacterium]|nr:phosphoribosylamine--glycine ligase [Clostridia bacterium]
MDLLLVGSGGREHALLKALLKSREVNKIYCLPGNAAMEGSRVKCVPIQPKQVTEIADFAAFHQVDFAVVAPDDPLALGAVNELEGVGVPAFGPDQDAARIESSKIFAKQLMKKYHIPTAAFRVFDRARDALSYVKTCPIPIVVKADGLALGKGVTVASTREEAVRAVKELMEKHKFGDAGSRIVIEECLSGPEVSVLCFTDGKTIKPMVSSMDHKRALDGDQGLNTGGMGVVAPNPFYTEEIAKTCMETIFLPTIRAMAQEGCPFKGCLYFGLMLTKDGPKVIEYNSRFGDPETQAVLPLLDGELLPILMACRNGTLETCEVKFKNQAACCVVQASKGYPQAYETGFAITLPKDGDFVRYDAAGVKKAEGGKGLVTGGGRVASVTAIADTLEEAVKLAYAHVDDIAFENAYHRTDIGQRALKGELE